MDETYVLEKRNKIMGMKQAFQDYQKVKEVLKSCNNEDQLRVGVKLVNLLDRKYGEIIPLPYWETLKNITGLMRIKCGIENAEEVNEIFNTKKHFDTQANVSGVVELQNAVFVEEIEDFPNEKTLKEINIGTQIEKNHCGGEEASTLATQNIKGISDYYTNPEYAIIAIKNEAGDNQKTVRISKEEMEELHDRGNISLGDMNIMYEEEWSPLFDDDEIEESTGTGSSGQYTGELFSGGDDDIIRKKFYDIPVTQNGIVGNKQTGLPISKVFSYGGKQNESEILEEDDLDEATTAADVGGVYDTPGFAPSEFMGTAGKKGKAPVNKGITHRKLAYPGGDFVKIKNRCARFPYCNQSPEAIKISKTPFKNAFYENKVIKKDKLKLK